MRRTHDGQKPVSLADLPRLVEDHVGHPLPDLYRICRRGFDCFEEDPTPNRIKIALTRVLTAADPTVKAVLPDVNLTDAIGVTRAVYDVARMLAEPIGDQALDAAVLYVMSGLHQLLVQPDVTLRTFWGYWDTVEKRAILSTLFARPLSEESVEAARARYRTLVDCVAPHGELPFDFFPSTLRQAEVVLHPEGIEPDGAWTRRRDAVTAVLNRMHMADKMTFRDDGEFRGVLEEADREIANEDAQRDRIETAAKALLQALGVPADADVTFDHMGGPLPDYSALKACRVGIGMPVPGIFGLSVFPSGEKPSILDAIFAGHRS